MNEFDFDVATTQSANRAADLLESTSDNCTHTPDSGSPDCFA